MTDRTSRELCRRVKKLENYVYASAALDLHEHLGDGICALLVHFAVCKGPCWGRRAGAPLDSGVRDIDRQEAFYVQERREVTHGQGSCGRGGSPSPGRKDRWTSVQGGWGGGPGGRGACGRGQDVADFTETLGQRHGRSRGCFPWQAAGTEAGS